MSPLQLASAYTTFATLGSTAQPRYVRRVEDEGGKAPWETGTDTRSGSLDPGVAYIITDILRDAVDYGTGTGVRSAGFRGPVAGTTGTTNDATDTWFVGYTPEVVGTVWIGYDTPSPLGRAATGGGLAAPVLGRVLREYRIDPYTGLVLEDGCQPNGTYAANELFLQDHVPATDCPYRDWWGDFWDRVGGIFGGGDDDGRPRRDMNRGRGNGNRDMSRGRGNEEGAREEEARSRERAIEEFMRERAERLRNDARRRGNNN
jgi:penicillin-binding protein 1A